jgi:DNA-binding CsgD family transcriptional regulator
MQNGNSVIIHNSPIIQQGLKNILLSRNIGISDVMNTLPDCTVFNDWKDLLLLIDTQYTDEYKKHGKVLKKNGNIVIGIGIPCAFSELESYFDDIIYINDNLYTINDKINYFISKGIDTKSDNQLSVREIEVLTMVAQGYSNKLIADQLFISIHTVITHRKNITFKLGIKSISGLTLYAALNNMVDFH